MRVAVERVKDKAIELKEDIPAKVWDMDSFDVEFVDNIHIDCKFTKVNTEIIADADINFNRLITCSRCMEKVRQALSQKFKRSYNGSSLGEYLDIDNDIREEILLNFPMKVLCKADCKGVCSKCGVNLNIKECGCQNSI